MSELEFARDRLNEIVLNTWESMVRMPIEVIADATPRTSHDSTIAAAVHILGSWQGSVTLQAPLNVAASIARHTLDIEAPRDEEIHAVFKELVNIIGGNLKSSFGQSCALSTPKVVRLTDWLLQIPAEHVVLKTRYRCSGELVEVNVHQSDRDLFEEIRRESSQ